MYHKIKVVRGSHSVRKTAKVLGISPSSVQKYSKMPLEKGADYLKQLKRKSQFEDARTFIEDELENFHQITATKLYRKIKAKYPEITAGVRSFRNYIKPIREKYRNSKIRLYHPVLNSIPGEQVQVDPGEYRVKKDRNGNELKVYFVSFVFSYSRMMYVSFQTRPYKTADFLKAHLEAFHYFGGVANEYVYDQTKLVVIEEKYREVWFNQQFHQFALKYEFLPIVCEGYDPESKGKVERTVRYIKEDFLYGDYFSSIESVRKASLIWLNEVANIRIHSTTRRQPCEMFLEEKPLLNTSFYVKNSANKRIVDKTGLLSFKGNKYSVPSSHQRLEVQIEELETTLFIRDQKTGNEIGKHPISSGKGNIIINNNHYRDFRKNLTEITSEVLSLLSEVSRSEQLIAKIQADNPKIIRDQLKGLIKLALKFSVDYWNEIIPKLLVLPQVRTSLVEKMLISVKQTHQVQEIEKSASLNSVQHPKPSTLDRSLEIYMTGVKNVR